jgi:uncharacterized membrane protein
MLKSHAEMETFEIRLSRVQFRALYKDIPKTNINLKVVNEEGLEMIVWAECEGCEDHEWKLEENEENDMIWLVCSKDEYSSLKSIV